jgi:hypothetical protein
MKHWKYFKIGKMIFNCIGKGSAGEYCSVCKFQGKAKNHFCALWDENLDFVPPIIGIVNLRLGVCKKEIG